MTRRGCCRYMCKGGYNRKTYSSPVAQNGIITSKGSTLTNYCSSSRRAVLQEEFVNIPSKFIDFQLKLSGNFYATYLALDLAEYTYVDTATPPYTRLKSPRKPKSNTFARLNEMEATGYGVSELRKEVEAARKKRTKEEGTSIYLTLPNVFLVNKRVHWPDKIQLNGS